MIYKDTLYKDQNVPSTEALLSEWCHICYIKDTENLKKNKRFAVLKQFLIILIEHTACIGKFYLKPILQQFSWRSYTQYAL